MSRCVFSADERAPARRWQERDEAAVAAAAAAEQQRSSSGGRQPLSGKLRGSACVAMVAIASARVQWIAQSGAAEQLSGGEAERLLTWHAAFNVAWRGRAWRGVTARLIDA